MLIGSLSWTAALVNKSSYPKNACVVQNGLSAGGRIVSMLEGIGIEGTPANQQDGKIGCSQKIYTCKYIRLARKNYWCKPSKWNNRALLINTMFYNKLVFTCVHLLGLIEVVFLQLFQQFAEVNTDFSSISTGRYKKVYDGACEPKPRPKTV